MKSRKLVLGLTTILLGMLLLPVGAMAEKLKSLWVTGLISQESTSSAEESPLDRLNAWYSKKEDTYYLFLPSGAQPAGLHLCFSGVESIEVDGTQIHSSDAVDFLIPGTEVTLTSGKTKYTLRILQSANIPAMIITTESGSLKAIHQSRNNQEKGTLLMLNADGSWEYSGALSQIKGRGNSTFAYPKKPYQIKLDKAADLCGMGKAKTWVLLADYVDHSLLRNRITFALADAAGMAYTSQCQPVDVYINQDYYGTYLLCEKVEIGASRIDIRDLADETEELNEKELDSYPLFGPQGYSLGHEKGYSIPENPTDITGGYLLEFEKPDRYKPELSGFATNLGQPVVIKEPEAVSKAQAAYISSLMQGFENAVFSKDGIDPDSGKHYTEFVDLSSLAQKYLIEEIGKNFDANRTSFYFYKPADEQSTVAFAGPVWDYDVAYGNFENKRTMSLKNPKTFSANRDKGEAYYLFPELYKHEDFYQAVVEQYQNAFVPALQVLLGQAESKDGKLQSIDAYAAEITPSAAMNFIRWPVLNTSTEPGINTGKTYQENVDYVKTFLTQRMAFLSETWVK